MYSTRLLFRLTLFCGLLITAIGMYLKVTDQISQGHYQYRRSGIDFKTETIDGNGTIILGLLMLLFSLYHYRTYKKQKADNDILRKKEDLEFLLETNQGIAKQKSKSDNK